MPKYDTMSQIGSTDYYAYRSGFYNKKNLRTQKQGHMENPGSAAGLLSPPN